MYPVDLLPSPFSLLNQSMKILKSIRLNGYCGAQDVYIPPAQFDVNIETDTGFLPVTTLPHLPEAFAIWENALAEASAVLVLGEDISGVDVKARAAGAEWRACVRSWPVIGTEALNTDKQLLRRAHKVLAFLVHFYAHSIPHHELASRKEIVIPRSIAVPLVEVSNILGMAPVLTFADTVLWNWELIDPSLPVSIDNMHFTDLFSSTEDERNFYFASARAEMRGIEFLHIVNEYHSLPDVTDLSSIAKISRDLSRLAGIIEEMTEDLHSLRDIVDPHMFYWQVRPWFVGTGDGESAPRWRYDGVQGSTDNMDMDGPSAGQSSVMHALDVFLDIDHKLRERRVPAPTEQNKKADVGFMERMRRYMPGSHREYLTYIGSRRPVRQLAQEVAAIRDPYNKAVMALKKLRDVHIRVVCLYVVSMSRSTPVAKPGCPMMGIIERVERERAKEGPALGTGGTALSVLLKGGRDATERTILDGRN